MVFLETKNFHLQKKSWLVPNDKFVNPFRQKTRFPKDFFAKKRRLSFRKKQRPITDKEFKK